MNRPRFDIIGAAAFGFQSVFTERRYLSGIALVPICIVTAIELGKIFALDKQSLITELVSLIPVSMAGAWFMFLQTRLLVFGERTPETYIAPHEERRRAFEACAILWTLTQVGALGLVGYMLFWQQQISAEAASAPLNVIGYLLIGASFWALRFSIAHILGATGYSIRDYIFRVNGAMVSLRLLALMMVVMFPIALMAMPVEEALIATAKSEDPAPLNIIGLSLLRVIFNFILLAVFNAAAVFALRQMLGKGKGKPRMGISV